MNIIAAILGYGFWLLADVILLYWLLEARVEQDHKGFRRTLIAAIFFNSFVGLVWWLS